MEIGNARYAAIEVNQVRLTGRVGSGKWLDTFTYGFSCVWPFDHCLTPSFRPE